jgi:hypothetical protein
MVMKAHDHQIQFKGENKGLNIFIGVLHPTLGPQQKIKLVHFQVHSTFFCFLIKNISIWSLIINVS